MSPLGPISFTMRGEELIGLSFSRTVEAADDATTERVRSELDAYFFQQGKSFTIPFRFDGGTDFEHKVWRALSRIPYGETRTYQDIAKAIGHDRAYRAVGQACRKNPIAIIIPCHRVIGKNRTMTGYRGSRTDTKKALLAIEGVRIGFDDFTIRR